MKTWYFYC